MSFVGDIVGGLIGARSAGKAANMQAQSAREANELQRYMFDQQRADTAPYRDAGASALAQIQALLKSPNSIRNSADYKFGLSEGTNALENSATANGMTYSGAQAKALQRYGQNYAATKLDQSFNRLAGIAGLGQVGGGAAQNYANNVGNNLIGVGNAQAAAQLARGSAYGNALNAGLAYGDRAGWFRSPGSFGPQLDPFFSGTGGSGD